MLIVVVTVLRIYFRSNLTRAQCRLCRMLLKGVCIMGTFKLPTQVNSDKRMLTKKDAIECISSAVETLGIYLASLHKLYDYEAILLSTSNALDELSSALINAGCNEEYIETYKKWGEFGWSFNASISKNFFITAPSSLKEADSIMNKYCDVEEITKMKEELKDAGVNKTDLEEAYFDYINRKYKSSVMLLFSLIDRQLISRNLFNKDGDLKTGASAIGELKKSKKLHKGKTHLHYLQFTLIIYCLLTLFGNSKNFEKEPSVVNRNSLIHGMSDNEVNESDCLKVWSALYSFVVIYPELEKEIL